MFASRALSGYDGLVLERSRIHHTETIMAEKKKDPAAVKLGEKGGKKGGPARADSLTSEERAKIAKQGADARWHPKKK